jgi:predicted thioesterase
MAEIPIGTKLEKKLLVDNEVAIDFLGLEGARVLATPWMYGFVL